MAAQPKHLPLDHSNYLTSESGIYSWLTTVDHKRVAILYLMASLFFMLLGGIEAMAIRTQLAVPNNTFLSANTYNQMFTMHGTTMIFMVVMPLELGFFANFLIPLQIGARDVAFPRINALSFWVFLFGALFMNLGWLNLTLPDGGWFGYANLTERYFSPGMNIDLWNIGLLILGISTLLSGLNFFVTIVNMRAPGMTFMRMPMFMWSMLVTTILILLAFPCLTVGLIFLFLDRFVGTHFYLVELGATPILWQHLFWLFGHPEVYIMALPAFGMMSEIIPVFSRKPLFGYAGMAYSMVLIGFLSYGVWGHHMFATGMGPVADSTFAITTMLIAIPTGIKIFSWVATVWGGSLRMKVAFYFGVAAVLEFTLGGLSGVMHASVPIDLQQTDTYFVVAHFHYVLFGGMMFAILGGFYYWWPKITGRMLNEELGKLHFWLTIVGFNGTFFPMHFLGVWGMPRRIYTYAPGMGWDFWNAFETGCAYLLFISFAIFAYNLIRSLSRDEKAEADPWDARTLEWATPSPPPPYNFENIPPVRGRDAFWVDKYGVMVEGHGHGSSQPAHGETSGVTTPAAAELHDASGARHPAHARAVDLSAPVRARPGGGRRGRADELDQDRRHVSAPAVLLDHRDGVRVPGPRRGASPSGRSDLHRHRPSQGRDVGVPRFRVRLFRLSHLDLHGLQAAQRWYRRRGAQHPADLVQHLHPADVELPDGAGAGGHSARRSKVVDDLAVRNRLLRTDIPGRSVLRVFDPVPARPSLDAGQHLRPDLLHPGRHARHPRRDRRHLADRDGGGVSDRQGGQVESALGRDRGALLALR